MQDRINIVSPFSLRQYQDSFQYFHFFLCVIFCFISFNISFFLGDHNGNTVKPVYSGHAIYRTPCNSGHVLVELVESRSNSYRKTPI